MSPYRPPLKLCLEIVADVTFAYSECFREGFVYVLFCFVLKRRNLQRCGKYQTKQRGFDLCFGRCRNLNSNLNTCVTDGCPFHKQKKM